MQWKTLNEYRNSFQIAFMLGKMGEILRLISS